MRKLKISIFIGASALLLLNLGFPNTLAATEVKNCPQSIVNVDPKNDFSAVANILLPKFGNYVYKLAIPYVGVAVDGKLQANLADAYGNFIWSFNLGRLLSGDYVFNISISAYGNPSYCNGTLTIPNKGQPGETVSYGSQKIEFNPPNPTGKDSIQAVVRNLQQDGRLIMDIKQGASGVIEKFICVNSQDKTATFLIDPLNEGEWYINIYKFQTDGSGACDSSAIHDKNNVYSLMSQGGISFNRSPHSISTPISTPTSTPTPILPEQCLEWADLSGTPIPTGANETQQQFIYKNGLLNSGKIKCVKIITAIGNINTDPAGLVKSIMGILLGLSGGVAVLLIIVSGYKFMASHGNPEALQGAREQLISAIVGLLFIIFSLVILQIIGVDILKIPGFSK